MIPKRIYLREAEFDDLFTGERMVACDEPYSNITVEFTNLSEVWHDASEEPEGANWKILCQDKNDCFWTENRIDVRLLYKNWNVFTEIEKIVRWAYVADILPKGGDEDGN